MSLEAKHSLKSSYPSRLLGSSPDRASICIEEAGEGGKVGPPQTVTFCMGKPPRKIMYSCDKCRTACGTAHSPITSQRTSCAMTRNSGVITRLHQAPPSPWATSSVTTAASSLLMAPWM